MIAAPMTIEQIADELGVSRQTIHEWKREGCPVDSPESVREWRREHKRPRMGSGPKGSNLADGEIQTQLLLAQALAKREDARCKKIKNDILEGKLMYVDAATQQTSEIILRIKHRLESVPDEIRNEFPAELRDLAQQLVADKIFLLLTEMSQWRLGSE